MTDTQFPLTRKAGLMPKSEAMVHACLRCHDPLIRLADVEKLLANAPVVNAHKLPDMPFGGWTQEKFGDTHTARLVLIEPIVRDTAESLLREMIADHEALLRADAGRKEWPLITRARKLLGRA